MVGPWIHALFGRRKRLSDIEYLAIKDNDGKRVDADAEVSIADSGTETDIVTVTANSGKDMYLGGAKMNFATTVGSGSTDVTFRLFVNGVELEKFVFRAKALGLEGSFEFLTKGVKVAATQIIKLTGQNSDATSKTVAYYGKLILFEETTGESPQV